MIADQPFDLAIPHSETDVLESAGPGSLPVAVSLVVPTRNEAGNIETLVTRLEQALADTLLEIIFVDDSDDGTVAAIEAIQAQTHATIHVIHRPAGQRDGGLGGAVVAGLRVARAAWVAVMDADLQHPPELVPELLHRAQQTGANLVVASRYTQEGTTEQFGVARSAISHGFTGAARVLFPGRLHGVSDPMSGFFVVQRAVLNLDQLRPRGFKILLEILVRTAHLRVAEVGFQFGERYTGESKASVQEAFRYFSHLFHLRLSENTLRLLRFIIIGLSGLLVNTLLLAFATEQLRIYYLWSAVLATQGSTLWNFMLTDAWVFSDRRAKQGRWRRLALFVIMNNLALTLRGPLLYWLTTNLSLYYLLSNVISLAAIMSVRYALADNLIWRRSQAKAVHDGAYQYNIHNIVTVESEVALPELQRFLIEDRIAQPTIRVRIGRLGRPGQETANGATASVRHLYYQEGAGQVGFGMDVRMGETIDVMASPLLRRSPHVLYTNIVEPILRWVFVEKGYALVHGACMAVGTQAYLITARTDTGKTTTTLRILARQRRAGDHTSFLSDDLTLVAPTGKVLPYPKPMTISHHTVRAVNTALLSRRERFTLPFQSRIHSRSGRRFAFLLTQTRLPVATVNAIAQWLVPPPKYDVTRIVPSVRVGAEARLAGLFVIERGGVGDVQLSNQEALDILMQNCEDAYGFPPYPAIKGFLYGGSNGTDLQSVERGIVAAAFNGQPATLLRSTTMDWAQRISNLINLPVERAEPRHIESRVEATPVSV